MKWAWILVLFGGLLVLLWVGLSPPPGSGLASRPSEILEEPPSASRLPGGLTPDGLIRLRGWLEGGETDTAPAPPERDIFQKGRRLPSPVMQPVEPLERAPVEPSPSGPYLAGFVFRRSEPGEKDERASSRTLAAIRFEGREWLVGEGEMVGPYRVERIVEEEEVYLLDTESGQEKLLPIE
jgi:hypothetical protein